MPASRPSKLVSVTATTTTTIPRMPLVILVLAASRRLGSPWEEMNS